MTKEIKKIKARTKIALTGTPLENSVLELWSIFDFIMPGYLNSIVRFREAYGIKDVDKDYVKDMVTGEESKTGLPKSNVLYYELENNSSLGQ